jgi:hypothetical protein
MNRQKQAEKIAQRMAQIPKIHQAVYKNAVSGKSRKDAVKSFCLMCFGWQKEEVRLCTDLACPLYPYRPYKNSKQAENRTGLAPESDAIHIGKILPDVLATIERRMKGQVERQRGDKV